MKQDVLCALPFLSLSMSPTGGIRPCCDNLQTHKNRDGSEYGFKNNNIEYQNSINSPLHKEIRQSMLQGERHSSCQRCWIAEDAGGMSIRQLWAGHFGKALPEIISNTNAAGEIIEVKLKHLEVTLGNECNLKCRMCSPMFSSEWVKDYLQFGPLQENFNIEEFKEIDWYKTERFFNFFLKSLESIEIINFIGGEPLINQTHVKLLKLALDSGRAKDMMLTYSSNITVVPQEVIKMWSRFGSVKIRVSCDGYGELYNYIRFPARWNRFTKNFENLLAASKTAPLEISLNTTLQTLNATRMHELFEWYAQTAGAAGLNRVPYINYVHSPEWNNPQILPSKLKIEATKSIGRFALNLRAMNQAEDQALSGAQALFKQMNQELNEEKNGKLWSEFRAKNLDMDKNRSQKLLSVLPELADYF